MYRHLFGVTGPVSIMQKTTQAVLGILLMITMSLSMGLGGMSVNDENVNHTSARGDTNCTSDEGCPDGYTCSSDGVCVAEETCDVDGDCPDGGTCEDGTCENTVHESSCEDTNQETNEDGTCGVCLDGYGLDGNGECVEDPSLDNSCTSDADCADGQICGAAGECMDAPDDSGNETDGNETNDGGDEPQYRNCTSGGYLAVISDLEIDQGVMVCDDETGEWVELEDTRPTSVEIGCDEEPTEEQLDASNFADLLNEHGEIIIRDGDDTIWMRTTGGSDHYFKPGVERQEAMNGSNGSCSFPACRAWDHVDTVIGVGARVFLIDISNNHSRTEMVVIEEENATHVTIVHESDDVMEDETEGRSHSPNGNGTHGTNAKGKKYFLNIQMDSGNGGYIRYQASVELACESNPPTNLSGCYWIMAGETSFNGSTVIVSEKISDGNSGTITEYGYYMSFSTCGNGSGGLGCPGDDVVWSGFGSGNRTPSMSVDDYILVSFSTGGNGSPPIWSSGIDFDGLQVDDGRYGVRLGSGGDGHIRLTDIAVQIGMDENRTATHANIVRSTTTDSGCLMVEDLESTNKDVEDESSGVLVAAGGVEVTTRDAAFVVGGVGVGLFGGSIITRILRPNVFNSTVKAHAEKAAAKERK